MLDAPKIQGWVRWYDRDGLDGIDCPGVYLIARFESSSPESVNPSDKHVVYIGETCRSVCSQAMSVETEPPKNSRTFLLGRDEN